MLVGACSESAGRLAILVRWGGTVYRPYSGLFCGLQWDSPVGSSRTFRLSSASRSMEQLGYQGSAGQSLRDFQARRGGSRVYVVGRWFAAHGELSWMASSARGGAVRDASTTALTSADPSGHRDGAAGTRRSTDLGEDRSRLALWQHISSQPTWAGRRIIESARTLAILLQSARPVQHQSRQPTVSSRHLIPRMAMVLEGDSVNWLEVGES